MLWIRLALRNTLRHPRRTLLTAGTVLAATALLTVLLAYLSGVIGGIVQDYTAAAGHVRIVSTAFAAREELHPLYENLAAADEVLEAVRAVPGVMDAQPRITTGVVITADEEIGDDFALVTGATDAYYRTHLRAPSIWPRAAGSRASPRRWSWAGGSPSASAPSSAPRSCSSARRSTAPCRR